MLVARNLGYTEVFPGFLFLSNAGHKLEILKMLSGTISAISMAFLNGQLNQAWTKGSLLIRSRIVFP